MKNSIHFTASARTVLYSWLLILKSVTLMQVVKLRNKWRTYWCELFTLTIIGALYNVVGK